MKKIIFALGLAVLGSNALASAEEDLLTATCKAQYPNAPVSYSVTVNSMRDHATVSSQQAYEEGFELACRNGDDGIRCSNSQNSSTGFRFGASFGLEKGKLQLKIMRRGGCVPIYFSTYDCEWQNAE